MQHAVHSFRNIDGWRKRWRVSENRLNICNFSLVIGNFIVSPTPSGISFGGRGGVGKFFILVLFRIRLHSLCFFRIVKKNSAYFTENSGKQM